MKTIKAKMLVVLVPVALSSCVSNERFEERMDRRSQGYEKIQQRREIRLEKRQERTDAWFERAMN